MHSKDDVRPIYVLKMKRNEMKYNFSDLLHGYIIKLINVKRESLFQCLLDHIKTTLNTKLVVPLRKCQQGEIICYTCTRELERPREF